MSNGYLMPLAARIEKAKKTPDPKVKICPYDACPYDSFGGDGGDDDEHHHIREHEEDDIIKF